MPGGSCYSTTGAIRTSFPLPEQSLGTPHRGRHHAVDTGCHPGCPHPQHSPLKVPHAGSPEVSAQMSPPREVPFRDPHKSLCVDHDHASKSERPGLPNPAVAQCPTPDRKWGNVPSRHKDIIAHGKSHSNRNRHRLPGTVTFSVSPTLARGARPHCLLCSG